MKAVCYDRFGSADVLTLDDLPMPEAGPGQLLVKVAAAGVNPIDRRLRAGELQDFFQRTWPIFPGWDFSGTVAGIGEGVEGWSVGDRVMGLAFTWHLHHGSYAEYLPVDVGAVTRIPDTLNFVQAAAMPLVSLTAWQALHEFAQLGKGSKVLIQAGAGGVGSVAIPMAKYLGAKVYTTTRAENWDYVTSRGADVPIDYSTSDYVSIIREAEPEGLDCVLETLIDETAVVDAIKLTRDGGSVPYMNNEPPDLPEIAERGINTAFLHHRADGEMLAFLVGLFADGTLPLPEIRTVPLEKARDAHRQSESGTTRGKLVLTIA